MVKRSENSFSQENIKRLVSNISNIDNLILAGLIRIDIPNRQISLHTFNWQNKTNNFKINYTHSLSQYMIIKSNGNDLDFEVVDYENKPLARYKTGGHVILL